jgi:IS30 family transposase
MSNTILLPFQPDAMTPAQLAAVSYLARYSGHTHQLYAYQLRRWFAWSETNGLDPLFGIQRAHVELFIRHLGETGLMPSSINTMMHGVRGFFRFAHIDGLVPADPAVYARLPKIHQDETRTQGLDRLELIRFLQVAQTITVHHGALAYLLGINALRASEAAAVRIEDYRETLRGHRVLHLDRRWSTAWSPEQIAHRLEVDFPDDESMRISHEAIYQSLFIQGRGALKRELVACLRTGRALREPRARSRNKPQGHVTADVVLSERPAEADDRAVPGHWEGDLIIGTGRSAIATLVERSSRSTLLVHLPRLEGWSDKPYVKNGPSLGGYGAVAMNAALTASITTLPEQLRKTLTWDRGKELSAHAQFALATGTQVFFADPHSPWQRPTNENTNGLLRQYFPKGTDLSRWSAEDLEAVAHALNNRPRKILDWKTPAEVFEEQLRSVQQPGVASTN